MTVDCKDIIAGEYEVIQKLGSGSFGDIYVGSDRNNRLYGIKVELLGCRFPQLSFECKVYRQLESGVGVPQVHWYGKHKENNVMVLDLLGPSLDDLFEYCGRRFTLKTVLMLADQMIARVEYVHSRGYLHRDIKPDNFLMGLHGEAKQVNIIDFGLSKRFWNPHVARHNSYKEGSSMTGTARYASVNAHAGIEQSRRDDLISLGYVLMYFLRGDLPWQGMSGESRRERNRKILQIKAETSTDSLCHNHPAEFRRYIEYCASLKYEQKPDYMYLRMLFRFLFAKSDFAYDGVYDWTERKITLNNQRTKSVSVNNA